MLREPTNRQSFSPGREGERGEKLAVGGQWKAVGWMETCPKNAMSNGEGAQGRKWDPRGWIMDGWRTDTLRFNRVQRAPTHERASSLPQGPLL